MKSLIALMLFQLVVMAIFGLAGVLAFHPASAGTMKETDDSLAKFVSWLAREKTWWGYAKRILMIVGVMSTVLTVVANMPGLFFVLYRLLIVFYCVLVAIALARCVSAILDLRSIPLQAILFMSLVVAAVLWVIHPNWLTLDISALIFAVVMLMMFRKMTFTGASILSAAIMLYDVLMVFGTQTMQKAAGKFIELPILLTVPSSLALDAEPLIKIGLGDIVLPGAIVILAFRKMVQCRNSALPGFAMSGYALGYAVTLVVLYVFRFPQPATIYLMPGALLGLVVGAWANGLLPEVMRD